MLIVNIATSGQRIGQIRELQQLKNQFGDSLVILAFPSNGFGNEPKTDQEILNFCRNVQGATFPIAQKSVVTGNEALPLFSWLTKAVENGAMDNSVSSDFQKFLVDETGRLVGVFSGNVPPMDSLVVEAIYQNYNF